MTFAQRRNRLTTHFSERIPVIKFNQCIRSYPPYLEAVSWSATSGRDLTWISSEVRHRIWKLLPALPIARCHYSTALLVSTLTGHVCRSWERMFVTQLSLWVLAWCSTMNLRTFRRERSASMFTWLDVVLENAWNVLTQYSKTLALPITSAATSVNVKSEETHYTKRYKSPEDQVGECLWPQLHDFRKEYVAHHF